MRTEGPRLCLEWARTIAIVGPHPRKRAGRIGVGAPGESPGVLTRFLWHPFPSGASLLFLAWRSHRPRSSAGARGQCSECEPGDNGKSCIGCAAIERLRCHLV